MTICSVPGNVEVLLVRKYKPRSSLFYKNISFDSTAVKIGKIKDCLILVKVVLWTMFIAKDEV